MHSLLALELRPKTIAALQNISCGFLWCAKHEARGGNCAVAWESVCSPKWMGGLGIPNLKWLNATLMARWLWLRRTDSLRPWKEFRIAVPSEALAIYRSAVVAIVGDGNHTLF